MHPVPKAVLPGWEGVTSDPNVKSLVAILPCLSGCLWLFGFGSEVSSCLVRH
jgi:hypothetical protein